MANKTPVFFDGGFGVYGGDDTIHHNYTTDDNGNIITLERSAASVFEVQNYGETLVESVSGATASALQVRSLEAQTSLSLHDKTNDKNLLSVDRFTSGTGWGVNLTLRSSETPSADDVALRITHDVQSNTPQTSARLFSAGYTNASSAFVELFTMKQTGSFHFAKSSGADLLWDTDGGGSIGGSAANRPDHIYALTDVTGGGSALKENELEIGPIGATNKIITALQTGSNDPVIRYNNAGSKWEFSNNGTTFLSIATEWDDIYDTDADSTLTVDTSDKPFKISQTSTSGYAFHVVRNLAAASTNSPLLYLHDDNAGDDQPVIEILQDGTGDALKISAGTLDLAHTLPASSGASDIQTHATLTTTGGALTHDGSRSTGLGVEVTSGGMSPVSGDTNSTLGLLSSVTGSSSDNALGSYLGVSSSLTKSGGFGEGTAFKASGSEWDTAFEAENGKVVLADNPDLQDVALTGTITIIADTNVSGSGTAFTTELVVGQSIITAGGQTREIATISDDTTATVTTAWSSPESGVAYYLNVNPSGLYYSQLAVNFTSGGISSSAAGLGQYRIVTGVDVTMVGNTTYDTAGSVVAGTWVRDITEEDNLSFTFGLMIGDPFTQTSNWVSGISCYAKGNQFIYNGTTVNTAVLAANNSPAANLGNNQSTTGLSVDVDGDGGSATTLTGTISVTIDTDTVTGTGTDFENELEVGSYIIIGAQERIINTITGPTSATVTENWSASDSGAYSTDYDNYFASVVGISVSPGSSGTHGTSYGIQLETGASPWDYAIQSQDGKVRLDYDLRDVTGPEEESFFSLWTGSTNPISIGAWFKTAQISHTLNDQVTMATDSISTSLSVEQQIDAVGFGSNVNCHGLYVTMSNDAENLPASAYIYGIKVNDFNPNVTCSSRALDIADSWEYAIMTLGSAGHGLIQFNYAASHGVGEASSHVDVNTTSEGLTDETSTIRSVSVDLNGHASDTPNSSLIGVSVDSDAVGSSTRTALEILNYFDYSLKASSGAISVTDSSASIPTIAATQNGAAQVMTLTGTSGPVYVAGSLGTVIYGYSSGAEAALTVQQSSTAPAFQVFTGGSAKLTVDTGGYTRVVGNSTSPALEIDQQSTGNILKLTDSTITKLTIADGGVTTFDLSSSGDGVTINQNSVSGTGLVVNQTNTGDIVNFKDSGTERFSMRDGGATEITASIDDHALFVRQNNASGLMLELNEAGTSRFTVIGGGVTDLIADAADVALTVRQNASSGSLLNMNEAGTTRFEVLTDGVSNFVGEVANNEDNINVAVTSKGLTSGTATGISVGLTGNASDTAAAIFAAFNAEDAGTTGSAVKYAFNADSSNWDYAFRSDSGLVYLTETLPSWGGGNETHLFLSTNTGTVDASNSGKRGISQQMVSDGLNNASAIMSGHHITMYSHGDDDNGSQIIGTEYSYETSLGIGGATTKAMKIYSGWEYALESLGGLVSLKDTPAQDESHLYVETTSPGLATNQVVSVNSYVKGAVGDTGGGLYAFYADADSVGAGNTFKVAYRANSANWDFAFVSASGQIETDYDDSTRAVTHAQNGTGNILELVDGTVNSGVTRFSVAPNGTVTFNTLATIGGEALDIVQNDADEPFINYDGTVGDPTTGFLPTDNITTEATNGNGSVVGPQGTSGGTDTYWVFEGMVRVSVEGTDYWMPYYSAGATPP